MPVRRRPGLPAGAARTDLAIARSGFYLDWRAVPDHTPELFDLFVSDGDAAVGPVVVPVSRTKWRLFVGEAMDHDVSTGLDAEPRGARAMGGVRIRDPQRQVIPAVRIPSLDKEEPFWRA